MICCLQAFFPMVVLHLERKGSSFYQCFKFMSKKDLLFFVIVACYSMYCCSSS